MKSLGKFPDPFLGEIAGQPEAMRRAAEALQDQVDALGRIPAILSGETRVTFTGMGASYAASHVPVTLLAGRGIDASLVDAAELLHFRRPMLKDQSVLVLVSQSGRSAELVALLESLGTDARPFVVSVTNGAENALAALADVALDTRVGEEHGPSTMTFAATLVVLAALVNVLAGREVPDAVRAAQGEAGPAAAAAAGLIEGADERSHELEAWFGERPRMVILARGTGLAAAETGALILKEAARVPAEALGSGQFRHGPLELAGPDLAAALLATERATVDLDLRLASDLVETGAGVLVIASARAAHAGTASVEIPEVGRALAPALSVIPLQLLAWRLSVRRGLTPHRLSIASKVTSDE